jgi:hypothetical protein
MKLSWFSTNAAYEYASIRMSLSSPIVLSCRSKIPRKQKQLPILLTLIKMSDRRTLDALEGRPSHTNGPDSRDREALTEALCDQPTIALMEAVGRTSQDKRAKDGRSGMAVLVRMFFDLCTFLTFFRQYEKPCIISIHERKLHNTS